MSDSATGMVCVASVCITAIVCLTYLIARGRIQVEFDRGAPTTSRPDPVIPEKHGTPSPPARAQPIPPSRPYPGQADRW